MNSLLLVGLGGAIGSMGRYGVGIFIGRLWPSNFPLGTMLVNIFGSLLMGLFIGFLARTMPSWQGEGRLFVAVGMFGGFTTFSSFSLDTIYMVERGNLVGAALYVVISVTVGLAALFAGLVVMRGALT